MAQNTKENFKVEIIAHRGFSGVTPENTIASIKKAMEIGVDKIEIDVHLTKYNKVVVIHDASIDRTTNGKGKVKDYTLEEIRNFDAGSWFSKEYASERIPTLDEVIKLINGQTELLIELKSDKDSNHEIEKAVIEIINKNNASKWCIAQSFNGNIINKINSIDSNIKVEKLYAFKTPIIYFYFDGCKTAKKPSKYKETQAINIGYKSASRSFIKRIHKIGKKVNVYTVNDEKTMKKLIDKGVDGIITNYPNKLKEVLKN